MIRAARTSVVRETTRVHDRVSDAKGRSQAVRRSITCRSLPGSTGRRDHGRSHAVCNAPSKTSSCSANHGSSSSTTTVGLSGSVAPRTRKAAGHPIEALAQ
ncbi:hypothetical protein [Saccharothrix sp. Mg75]|uniref:hypothetical protein n=1 Tax=Saccharothrix sp. Mg75 TaxID=3445357 RepID=UPI003EED283E